MAAESSAFLYSTRGRYKPPRNPCLLNRDSSLSSSIPSTMSSASKFARANLEDVVGALNQEEAISLISGVGFWNTAAIPRLNVPSIKVSDGPNGVRGNRFFNSTPAKAIPSATALGSTFDTDLIHEVASKLLAPEAKLRAASVILGPTVNIQRSPLGGRSFESFSEDPTLSGRIAAAYVDGLQRQGIGACIKHFVANDQEDDRQGVSAEVSPRALREIYLMPFMLAEKLAKPWAYMTSYNKVNGLHASENPFLLKDVLRKDWGSETTVMSDWFGVYSISDSINAGLDLEMPGTRAFRSQYQVSWSIHSRKTTLDTVKQRAHNVLKLVQKCAAGAPELLDGDGEERTEDKEEDKALMRSLAAQTIVLLKNEGNVLPLQQNPKKIAIIGGNAKANILSGGGSASLKPSFLITPFEGITAALGKDTKVLYTEGAQALNTLPNFEREVVTSDGQFGFDGAWYSHDENDQPLPEPMLTQRIDSSLMFLFDGVPSGLTPRYTFRCTGHFKPRDEDQLWNFGSTAIGRSRVYIDGNLVVDTWTNQRMGKAFFGMGCEEMRGQFHLKQGVAHEVVLEFTNLRGQKAGEDTPITTPVTEPGVQFGAAPCLDEEREIEKAVAIAKEADVAILVVGLNADFETEGYDRTTLKLPGRTDELVRRVAQANKNTVVVTQAGSSIEMPWVDEVPALIHSWYLGNSTGEAIADVLFGKVNPSAKLSLTFPRRLEDTPSYGHMGSENGTVWYAENLFVGYKHYVHKAIPTLFPFGYGLSYSSFEFSNLQVSQPSGPEFTFSAKVTVQNTGSVVGSEVVQIYVSPSSTTKLTHPVYSLRGFAKAKDVQPGKCVEVEVTLDKYALSYWCDVRNQWKIEAGTYKVMVGVSAEKMILTNEVNVEKENYWNGL